MELLKKTAIEQHKALINKEVSAEELVKASVERIEKLDCPRRITIKLEEELERFKLCNSNSPEIGILRNYIDTLLSLPWNISTKENTNLESITFFRIFKISVITKFIYVLLKRVTWILLLYVVYLLFQILEAILLKNRLFCLSH